MNSLCQDRHLCGQWSKSCQGGKKLLQLVRLNIWSISSSIYNLTSGLLKLQSLYMIEKSLVETRQCELNKYSFDSQTNTFGFQESHSNFKSRSLLGCLPYKKMQQGEAYQTDGAATSQWTYEGKYMKSHECNFQSLDNWPPTMSHFTASTWQSLLDIHPLLRSTMVRVAFGLLSHRWELPQACK